MGDYINPYTLTEPIKRNQTVKSLKLAYVALSRPIHLAAIAVPAHLVSKNDSIFNRLNKNGWLRYDERVGQNVEL